MYVPPQSPGLVTDSAAPPKPAPVKGPEAPDPRQALAVFPWLLAGLLVVVAGALARGVSRW